MITAEMPEEMVEEMPVEMDAGMRGEIIVTEDENGNMRMSRRAAEGKMRVSRAVRNAP